MSIGLSSLRTMLDGLHLEKVEDYNKAVSAWQYQIEHYKIKLVVPVASLMNIFILVKKGDFDGAAGLCGKYGFSSVWCNPVGDGLLHYTAKQSVMHIKEYNAMQCEICNGSAHLLNSGMYQCMENAGHYGDGHGFVDDAMMLAPGVNIHAGVIFSPKIDGIHPSGWTKFIGGFKKPKKQKKLVVIAPLLANPKSKFGMMARAKLDGLKKSQHGY